MDDRKQQVYTGITPDQLESILNRVHEWTRSADQKLSILVSIQALMFAIPIPLSMDRLVGHLATESCLVVILAVLSLFSLAAAFVCSLLALLPRIKAKTDNLSILHFGDIARRSLEEYKSEIRQESLSELEDDFVSQIHISSEIAAKKHTLLRWSIATFVFGIVFALVAFFVSLVS